MGYAKDLEDYEDSELTAELQRREDARNRGMCDYCNRESAAKPCGKPNRHNKGAMSNDIREFYSTYR